MVILAGKVCKKWWGRGLFFLERFGIFWGTLWFLEVFWKDQVDWSSISSVSCVTSATMTCMVFFMTWRMRIGIVGLSNDLIGCGLASARCQCLETNDRRQHQCHHTSHQSFSRQCCQSSQRKSHHRTFKPEKADWLLLTTISPEWKKFQQRLSNTLTFHHHCCRKKTSKTAFLPTDLSLTSCEGILGVFEAGFVVPETKSQGMRLKVITQFGEKETIHPFCRIIGKTPWKLFKKNRCILSQISLT